MKIKSTQWINFSRITLVHKKAKERLNVMISQRDELTEAIEDLRRHLDLGKKELDRMQKTRMKNNVEIML